MKGEYIGRIQGLYKMEFIWVQEEETGIGKVDTENELQFQKILMLVVHGTGNCCKDFYCPYTHN